MTRAVLAAVLLLLAPAARASGHENSQEPALAASSTTVCRLPETKPLLLKARYNPVQYQRRALQDKPLILEEKLRLNPDLALRIETRACEDAYAKFEFFVKDATSTAKAWLDPAGETLKNLHLNPDALIKDEAVAQIVQAVSDESKADHPKDDFDVVFVCLKRGKKSCASDVSIELKPPKLTLLYIDRP